MAAACSTAVSAGEQEGGIVVLYTNDIHCAVNEDEENQVLGYARIAGLKKQLEAEGNDVIPCRYGRRDPGRCDRHLIRGRIYH